MHSTPACVTPPKMSQNPATTTYDLSTRLNNRSSDITLWCRGYEFKSHKSVLIATSPFFKNLLPVDKETTCEDIEKVHLDDLQPEGVIQILEFIYNDRLMVTIDNVQCIMQAAMKLDMKIIYKKCVFLLANQLTPDYFIHTWNIADSFADEVLKTSVVNYCASNYHRLKNLKTFLTLPLERMRLVLHNENLSASGEQILETVIEWIRLLANTDKRDEMTSLLYILRSNTASKNYLERLEDDEHLLADLPSLRYLLIKVLRQRQLKNLNLSQSEPLITRAISAENNSENPFLLAFVETEKSRTVFLNIEIKKDSASFVTEPKISPFSVRLAGNITVGDRLFSAGGKTEHGEYLYDFIEFNYALNEITALTGMTTARAQLSLALHEGFIYAIGGYNSDGELADVERYSINDDSWSISSPMTAPRSGVASLSFLGKLYAIGGRRNKHTLSLVEYYSTESDQWSMVRSLVNPRTNCSIVTINDNLFVVGGFWTISEHIKSVVNQIQRYDVARDFWYDVNALVTNELITTAFSWQDKVYAVSASGHVYSFLPESEMVERVCCIPCSKGLLRCGFGVGNGNFENNFRGFSQRMWSVSSADGSGENNVIEEETRL